MKNRILITAGHAGSTAYALIETIKEKMPDAEIVFVGAGSAVEGRSVPTLENTYFPKIGVKYINIITGRIQRKFTLWTIPSILKIPFGFLHAFYILINVRPNVTVSFGGFSAFPVVVVSKIFRIPVIIHEQTASAGRANLASAIFADVIAVSRKESMKYFPAEKCRLTGNPISKEVVKCAKKTKTPRNNAIFIAGGSRGSKFINENIKSILKILLEDFTVYHQTGHGNFSEFERFLSELNPHYKKKYHPFPTVEMWNWYKYLNNSDLLVSRAGANIVSEAIYLRIPSIFIPIAFSYKNEQYENALIAKNLGLAEIIKEKDLSPEMLLKKIFQVSENWKKIVNESREPEIDDSLASIKLYEIIKTYA